MTTIETPPPASPEPTPRERRSGFYVAPWILAVLGGLVLLAVGFVVGRAVDRRDHDHPGRGFFRGGDGGGGHPGLRVLVVLIVLALIVTVIVLLVRHFTTPRRDAAPLDTATHAEQVLADRFARGEIDEAEFVSRRNALRT